MSDRRRLEQRIAEARARQLGGRIDDVARTVDLEAFVELGAAHGVTGAAWAAASSSPREDLLAAMRKLDERPPLTALEHLERVGRGGLGAELAGAGPLAWPA